MVLFSAHCRNILAALFAGICLVFAACSPNVIRGSSDAPRVEAGALSSPNWSFFEGAPLQIVGDWEVVWGQLVGPEQFDQAYGGEHFMLPARWNGVEAPGINGSFGTATFRVKLDLPNYDRELSYHLIAPHAAYRVYIDGILVVNNGTISETKQGFQANYVSRSFKGTAGQSTVVMQVANFKHAYGGPGHALTLWDGQRLDKFLDSLSLTYGLVAGIMFTIGLFHLILYLADRKDRKNSPIHLWFSILCFVIVYRVQGIIPFFHDYFPDTNYWESLRFTYSSLFAAPAVYLLFFRAVYPDYFPRLLTNIIIGVCLFGLIFTFVTSEYAYTLTRDFSIWLNVFVIIYSLIFTVRAALAKATGAVVILITNLIFLGTALNDALIYTDKGSGFDMTPLGILVLGLGYSYALLRGLRKTFQAARDTSAELATLNLNLEKQVKDRTLAFQAATAKAENAAEERARFIAAASHDLRQPLHALAMFNAALKSKLKQNTGIKLVEQQESAIASLAALLQDTLDTARLDIHQKEPVWADANIGDYKDRLSGIFLPLAKTRQIDLTFSSDEGAIVTDKAMLQRILSNLIDNALKAAQLSVNVSMEHQDNAWCFKVSDDGAGIAAEDIGRIFESYISLEDKPDPKRGGYGLGLFVVKEFTEALNGRVQLDSELGRGSTFTITLPNHIEPGKSRDLLSSAHISQSSLLGINILAIDDDINILEAMEVMISEWGALIKTARNQTEAMSIFDKGFSPDLILLDYNLSGTTGLEVKAAIETNTKIEIPSIVLTGATEKSVLDKVHASGIQVLEKPVDPNALLAAIMSELKGL